MAEIEVDSTDLATSLVISPLVGELYDGAEILCEATSEGGSSRSDTKITVLC